MAEYDDQAGASQAVQMLRAIKHKNVAAVRNSNYYRIERLPDKKGCCGRRQIWKDIHQQFIFYPAFAHGRHSA